MVYWGTAGPAHQDSASDITTLTSPLDTTVDITTPRDRLYQGEVARLAGRPIRRAMIAELERQAAKVGPEVTAIDVVCEYIAEGADADGTPHTLAELARLLTDKTKQTISAGVLTSWLSSTSEGKAKIAAARALAAHVHAEASLSVLDELAGTEVTREEVALARARADTRQWLASKWNRGTYGADAAVQVTNNTFNLAEQHLAALVERKRIKAVAQVALPPAEPDFEVVPADDPLGHFGPTDDEYKTGKEG